METYKEGKTLNRTRMKGGKGRVRRVGGNGKRVGGKGKENAQKWPNKTEKRKFWIFIQPLQNPKGISS